MAVRLHRGASAPGSARVAVVVNVVGAAAAGAVRPYPGPVYVLGLSPGDAHASPLKQRSSFHLFCRRPKFAAPASCPYVTSVRLVGLRPMTAA